VASSGPRPGVAESQLGAQLGSFLEASFAEWRPRTALFLGVSHLQLLASAAHAGAASTVVVRGRRPAQAASAFAERHHLRCRIVAAEEGRALDRSVPRPPGGFEAVVIDRSSDSQETLHAALESGQRLLAPAGHLWLFETSESVIELRRKLGEAGFACQRLSPIEAEDVHVLAAVVFPAPAVRAVSVA
jgi:hypothetical protein